MYSFLGNNDSSGYDEIYYNCDIVNGRTLDQGSSTDPPVKFNETRDSPIIKDASKYDFAIVRFTMDGAGKDLPIWMPVIEQGLTPAVVPGVPQPTAEQLVAINKSVYKITLRVVVNGVEYISREFPMNPTGNTAGALPAAVEQGNSLMFVPEDNGAERPFAPQGTTTTTQDLKGRYYFVSTYSHVVRMVNATFNQAWQDLENRFVADNPALNLQSHAPVMSYNSTTGLFSIHCDNYGYGSNGYGGVGATLANPVMEGTNNTRSNVLAGSTQTENWDIFFNSNMYGLFANFPMKYWGGDTQTGNRTYQILSSFPTLNAAETIGGSVGLVGSSADNDNNALFNNSGNRVDTTYPGAAGTYNIEFLIIEQDYVSTGTLWSPIGAIVFTTTLIPVVNEFVGVPQRFGDSNDASSSTTQNAFQPIITDIALPIGAADDYRKFLEYVPSAEYRMISLSSSHQEIKNIDIQVFWKNRLDGTLIPVRMFNLSSISVKMSTLR